MTVCQAQSRTNINTGSLDWVRPRIGAHDIDNHIGCRCQAVYCCREHKCVGADIAFENIGISSAGDRIIESRTGQSIGRGRAGQGCAACSR